MSLRANLPFLILHVSSSSNAFADITPKHCCHFSFPRLLKQSTAGSAKLKCSRNCQCVRNAKGTASNNLTRDRHTSIALSRQLWLALQPFVGHLQQVRARSERYSSRAQTSIGGMRQGDRRRFERPKLRPGVQFHDKLSCKFGPHS